MLRGGDTRLYITSSQSSLGVNRHAIPHLASGMLYQSGWNGWNGTGPITDQGSRKWIKQSDWL